MQEPLSRVLYGVAKIIACFFAFSLGSVISNPHHLHCFSDSTEVKPLIIIPLLFLLPLLVVVFVLSLRLLYAL